jgi:ribosomal protein S4E
LYRKHELVKLYEFAQELDLEKITSTTDYELSQVNRRTITENGVTQVVCEIGQVPIWSYQKYKCDEVTECKLYMRVDDTKNYKRDNPVSMTRRIQNTGHHAVTSFTKPGPAILT